ncbi:MAG: peptidylprolyl isomerase, partial [Bacteroidota bacterium]
KDAITNNKINDLIKSGQLVQDFKLRWAHQEKRIISNRLEAKLGNMVVKGMYTPGWMAEVLANEQSQKVDFLYVQVPFDEIDNSEVKLEDADYKAYFEENKTRFKQDEETRKVEYVLFPVVASAQDSTNIRQRLTDLADDFHTAQSDSNFVEANQGTIDEAYFKKEQLSPAIADTIFDLPVGTVYGPYFDGGSYKMVKVLDKKVIPDSVRSRHILRKADDQASAIAAIKTVDSLKALLDAGTARFDSLAAKFGTDATMTKGGDLGFYAPGGLVKPFNDLIFFKAEPGKVYKVATEFGVHLVEVTDRKFSGKNEPSVKVAYLSQEIIPSDDTQRAAEDQAIAFQESVQTLEQLRKAAEEKKLTVATSPGFEKNAYAIEGLGAGDASRQIVRWSFGTAQGVKPGKVGQVSPKVYSFREPGQVYTSKFAVVGLKSTRPAGTPSWQDLKEDIEPQVLNRKKGEIIAERIKGKTDLASIAATFSAQVDTATSVTFASAFIPKANSSEPKVVGTALKLPENQVSEPIAGNSGVFVISTTHKYPPAPEANTAQLRNSNQMMSRSSAKARIMQALKKDADIEDNRSKFPSL